MSVAQTDARSLAIFAGFSTPLDGKPLGFSDTEDQDTPGSIRERGKRVSNHLRQVTASGFGLDFGTICPVLLQSLYEGPDFIGQHGSANLFRPVRTKSATDANELSD